MLTAQPLTTIHRDRPTKLRQTLAQIEQIIEQYDVDRIVVGWPKKLDNEEGERCEKTKEFGDMLENRTGLEIIYQDEMCIRDRLQTSIKFNRKGGGLKP